MESRERREAGDILGRLGDPRFDAEVFHLPRCYRGSPEPLLGFIEVRSDSFTMGSEAEDKMAFDDERPSQPDLRVMRGGSWILDPRLPRCAFRNRLIPDAFINDLGFRGVLSLANSES